MVRRKRNPKARWPQQIRETETGIISEVKRSEISEVTNEVNNDNDNDDVHMLADNKLS